MKKTDFDKFIFKWFLITTACFGLSFLWPNPEVKPIVILITAGLWISLGLGTYITPKILTWLRTDIKKAFLKDALGELEAWEKIPEVSLEERLIKPHVDWFVGFFERLLFSIFAAISLGGAIVPMGGWLALKLATGWHRRKDEKRPYVQLLIRQLSMAALVVSTISLCFAGIGGFLLGVGLRKIWPKFPNMEWIITLLG